MNFEKILKKHNCENIDQALDKLCNDPSFKPGKPYCKKCEREVDYCTGQSDFCTNTYIFEVRCHGVTEVVQGEFSELCLLPDYVFEG